MIKILVQEPSSEGIDSTPFEILVPAIPRRGDSFNTASGGSYSVANVSFREEKNRTYSVLILLTENDAVRVRE